MVCLVTGSSRGLGKAIALAMGARGYKVAVHFRERKSEADAVSSMIKESIALGADVRNGQEVRALVKQVVVKWGGIDVLVNNAGITKEALLIKTTEKDFDEVIDVNLKGAYNFTKAVMDSMIKQKSGHIINISSYAGVKGKEGLAAYAASKAALIGFTVSAARELGEHNIMVNAVLPGYMMTDMGKGSSNTGRQKALNESITGEYSAPSNVAEFICYLAGTKGITGQVFNLDSRII